MSDEINWLPVLGWSAAVAFQIGTLFDHHRRYASDMCFRQVATNECDHCRLNDGETRHGWRLVLPQKAYFSPPGNVVTYIAHAGLRTETADGRRATIYAYSIPIRSLLNGRSIFEYRLYSLISVNITATLFKLKYDNDQWWLQYFQYIGERCVAGVFQEYTSDSSTGVYRVMIADCRSRRQPKTFKIQAPARNAELFSLYIDSNTTRLMCLFQNRIPAVRFDQMLDEEVPAWRFEIHLIGFEWDHIGRSPMPAASWESISIPGGTRDAVAAYPSFGSEALAVMYQEASPEEEANYLCLTFGLEERWRLETFAQWCTTIEWTTTGARLLDASRAMNNLRSVFDFAPYPPLPNLWHLDRQAADGVNFCRRNYCGILRRWCEPPPLKFLAAEALLKANPNLNRSCLKDAVGFDPFEDIPDENGEDTAPIVFW